MDYNAHTFPDKRDCEKKNVQHRERITTKVKKNVDNVDNAW